MNTTDYLGEKPQTRELSGYFDRLDNWVSRRMAANGQASLAKLEATPPGANGYAGESFVVGIDFRSDDGSRRTERFLLKRKPTKHVYFPEHDFETEFRVQHALGKHGRVPVAPATAYESDSAVLGAPFYLLGFVKGRPTPDRPSYHHEGWLLDLEGADQRAICTAGLRSLATLHSVSLKDAEVEFLDRGSATGTQLDWDLGYWDRFCSVSWPGDPIRGVQDGRAWLERNKPAQRESVISWGDARPGNILFDGTRCVAMIDWDMVSSGPPEKDLGYWLAMDLQFERVAEQVGGGSRLTGWPGRDEMVEIYEAAASKPVDRKRLRYHRVFAAYQIACLYARYVTMRKDLDEGEKAAFINENAPPIALLREELESSSCQ